MSDGFSVFHQVTLLGRDTRLFAGEDERNAYASFIYETG